MLLEYHKADAAGRDHGSALVINGGRIERGVEGVRTPSGVVKNLIC